jgi:hypothetical protein
MHAPVSLCFGKVKGQAYLSILPEPESRAARRRYSYPGRIIYLGDELVAAISQRFSMTMEAAQGLWNSFLKHVELNSELADQTTGQFNLGPLTLLRVGPTFGIKLIKD